MSKYESRKDSKTGISRMVDSSSGKTIAEDLKNKSVRKRGFIPVRSYIRTAKSNARSTVSSEPIKDASFQAYFSKFCRPLNNGVEYRIGDAVKKMGAGAQKIRLVKEASITGLWLSESKLKDMPKKDKAILAGTAAVPLAGQAALASTAIDEVKGHSSKKYHRKRVKKGFQASTPSNVKKIREILLGKEKIRMVPGMPAAHMGPKNRFMTGVKTQHVSIAAHELGHLSGKAGKSAFWHKAQTLARTGTPAAAFAGWFTKPGGKGENIAVGASVAGTAAIIGEEARASIKGYRAMKKAKFTPKTLKHGRKSLLVAGGTYAGAGAGVLLNAYLLKQRKKWKKNKETLKKASDVPRVGKNVAADAMWKNRKKR